MANSNAAWQAFMSESAEAVRAGNERRASAESDREQAYVDEIRTLNQYIAEHVSIHGAIVQAIMDSAKRQGIDLKQVLSGRTDAELTASIESLRREGKRLYRGGVTNFDEIRRRGENYHPSPTEAGGRWRI